MKLAQTGLGLLSGHSCEQVEGKRDDNKEVYLLIQFLTVPDTNNLIVNIKVYKLK